MKPPGHRYTREELLNLKRTEIQRLCKDYGVRANMKTDALVELLLDSIRSNMSPLVRPPPQQQPGNVVRRVSTRSSSRTSSLRSRGASGSSSSRFSSGTHPNGHLGYSFSGSSHTSKSKNTQYRLGVGRPTTVGGSGARRSTRSSSMAHSRRGKNSRSLRLPEVVIQEEPETSETQTTAPVNQIPQQFASVPVEWNNTSPDHLAVPLVTDMGTTYNEGGWEQILSSVKDLPSQMAWLHNSLQQRESDIRNLHNELHLCKAEVSELRGHIIRIPALENDLRATKESLEKINGLLHEGKGKGIRRVSVPLGENNAVTNSPHNNTDTPLASGDSATPRAHDAFAVPESVFPYVTINTLGKRRQPDDQTEVAEAMDGRENKYDGRPDSRPRKTLRTTTRKPLQEKAAGFGRLLEKPTRGQESGEESVASSGVSSGPSTAPSIGTPPPASHEPRCFDEPQEVHNENSIFNFSFRQATSSTPRNEVFNYFEPEPFSPGSAMKELAQRAVQNVGSRDHLQPPFEIRRISAAAARPQTPKRQTGPDRFRVTTEQVPATPAHEDVPPYDPYADDLFGLQNVNGHGQFINGNAGTGQVHGYPSGPMSLNQLGLDTNVTSASSESQTPVHKTAYGTEVQTDKRFGDFGRDGLGTSSNINFWAPFRC